MYNIVKLLVIGLWVGFKEVIFFFQDLIRYRHSGQFIKVEWLLWKKYLFINPYYLCKRHLRSLNLEDQPYGETTLRSLDHILARAQICEDDYFVDLGCGRGKLVFWVNCHYNCRSLGIDLNPIFMQHAKAITQQLSFAKVEFSEGAIEDFDLSKATVLYLYGSAFTDDFLYELTKKLQSLSQNTKIISVSFPLNDYCQLPAFETIDAMEIQFIWGSSTVYVQKPLGVTQDSSQ